MRLSRVDRNAKIVELYRGGWSYRQLQKKYHVSPNYVDRLVKGIEVKCSMCAEPKGKVRFHAHHPDRSNRPHYTIPLCPSCHAKEEARLRRDKEGQPQSFAGPPLLATANLETKPSTVPIPVHLGPLSPTEKKILIGGGIALVTVLVVEALSPGFFGRRWHEIRDHWQKTSTGTSQGVSYTRHMDRASGDHY